MARDLDGLFGRASEAATGFLLEFLTKMIEIG